MVGFAALTGVFALGTSFPAGAATAAAPAPVAAPAAALPGPAAKQAIVAAALSQIGRTTKYDPAYVPLAYPGGDVPITTGVCTDVIIRAFHAIGIDLQVAVHQDMLRAFSAYPRSGRNRPDPNIDHRRVKNLTVFFTRAGAAVPKTQRAPDYVPGDIVMWDVGGLAHTGLVADARAPGTDRHLIVHNIGGGTELEDILFEFPITGHFRYPVAKAAAPAA